MERKTSRCPAACSRPDFASWIAGFFSSVVCRTLSSVIPAVEFAKQAIKMGRKNFSVVISRKHRKLHAGEHTLPACSSRQLATNSLRHVALRSMAFGQRPVLHRKSKSPLHRWLSLAGGRARSEACAALRFSFFAFLRFDPKSSASAELAQACARRARATLCK